LLAIASSVTAQEAHTHDGRLKTIAEALQQYGIQQDEISLKIAHSNPNPQIRGLAAFRLAEEGDKDSLPTLLAAFKIKDQPRTKADIAVAVAQLGSSIGVAELRATCDAKKR
jgi:HEAT repeat protein